MIRTALASALFFSTASLSVASGLPSQAYERHAHNDRYERHYERFDRRDVVRRYECWEESNYSPTVNHPRYVDRYCVRKNYPRRDYGGNYRRRIENFNFRLELNIDD